jgi:hypothetical protein
MSLLRKRAWPWAVVAVVLAILGLVVFDGVIGGIALFLMAVAFCTAILRALADADMSGVSPGGGAQGG